MNLLVKKIILLSVFSTGFTLINISQSLAITLGFFSNPDFSLTGLTANLLNTLEGLDYTVTEFDSLDGAIWQEIASSNEVIVIPDLNDSLFDALPNTTRTVIRNYVNQGGGFLSVGDDFYAKNLFNGLFGWNITDNFFGAPTLLNTANATGTIFETGPSFLPITPLTTTLSIASLPTGSMSFYDNVNNPSSGHDSSSVFVSPFGLGKVAYNGFDYGDVQDSLGWPEATDLTLQFIAGTPLPATVPEPSLTTGLLLSGLGIIGGGIRRISRTNFRGFKFWI